MKISSPDIRIVSPGTFPMNWGVSMGANELRRKIEEIQEHLVRSITFGDRLAKMLEDLFAAKREYSVDNWDGYGAKAIESDSFNNAVNFALSLPSSIPTPEIYVDPDGDVTFEWYEGKRRVFSVTVGRNNEIVYAGLYGASKAYGVEQVYEEIPSIILQNINKLYRETG